MSMNVQAMRPREHTHFRAEVGRFGGMINSGHATAIPNATYGPASEGVPLWGEGSNSTEFLTRHKPEVKSFGAGVPGYAGFKPHGKNPWTGKSTELFEPHLGLSGNSALDVSKQPYASIYMRAATSRQLRAHECLRSLLSPWPRRAAPSSALVCSHATPVCSLTSQCLLSATRATCATTGETRGSHLAPLTGRTRAAQAPSQRPQRSGTTAMAPVGRLEDGRRTTAVDTTRSLTTTIRSRRRRRRTSCSTYGAWASAGPWRRSDTNQRGQSASRGSCEVEPKVS